MSSSSPPPPVAFPPAAALRAQTNARSPIPQTPFPASEPAGEGGSGHGTRDRCTAPAAQRPTPPAAGGSDPLNPDTDGDGLADGIEVSIGRRPFDPDTDGDGLTNSVELERGTDPVVADSDGDGVLDGADAFPLDPTKSQAVADPNDHTPPVITLQEPANATPLP